MYFKGDDVFIVTSNRCFFIRGCNETFQLIFYAGIVDDIKRDIKPRKLHLSRSFLYIQKNIFNAFLAYSS